MKKSTLIASSLALLAIVFSAAFLSSCNEATTSADLPENDAVYVDPALEYYEFTYPEEELEGGDIDNELVLRPTPGNDDDKGRGHDKRRGGRGEDDRKHPKRGFFLGKIFREMEVTPEQMQGMREIFEDHKDCIMAANLVYRESVKTLMEPFHERRVEILDGLKDGTYTREEARAELRINFENARQALADDDSRADYLAAKCDCLKEFLANIRETLTDEQKVIWDEWYNNLEGPCFGDEE